MREDRDVVPTSNRSEKSREDRLVPHISGAVVATDEELHADSERS